MTEKKAAKTKAARGVQNLPAKTLTVKKSQEIRAGGKDSRLLQACCPWGHDRGRA